MLTFSPSCHTSATEFKIARPLVLLMPFSLEKINILRLSYLACGGVYTADEVPRRIKYIWCGFSVFLAITNLSLGAAYLLFTKTIINKKNVVEFIILSIPFTVILCITPYITYRHRDRFRILFNCIEGKLVLLRCIHAQNNYDNRLGVSLWTFNYNHVMQNPSQEGLFWISLGCLILLPSILVRPIGGIFFSANKNFFRDIRYHIWLFPLSDYISSVEAYLVIYIVESLIILFLVFLHYMVPVFIIMLSTELCNMLVNYCSRIENLGKFMNDQIDCNRMSLKPTAVPIVEKELILLVKQHQEFRKYVILELSMV